MSKWTAADARAAFGFPADPDTERDPIPLIMSAERVLAGQREAIKANLPWDAYQLAAAQRQLILLERLTRRLRVVMAMQRGPGEDQDWQGVEQHVAEIERRERTVRGATR